MTIIYCDKCANVRNERGGCDLCDSVEGANGKLAETLSAVNQPLSWKGILFLAFLALAFWLIWAKL